MSIIGAIATGLGTAIGGIGSSIFSSNAASENTAKQIAWERERAKNAHQWEVQDLTKAGLNPILSAGGSGAATGSISPQMPDFNGINTAAQALGNIPMNKINLEMRKKELDIAQQNADTEANRVANETKATDSNIELQSEQKLEIMERKLNYAVERNLISQKAKTEIMNRAKLQSDIDLNTSQEFLNMQLKAKAETEIDKLEKDIKILEEELKLYPEKKERMRIENDLTEKENKIYYLKETVNEVTRIGAMGLSIYGAFQANNAISAYKANQQKTMFTEMYGRNGEFIGGRRSYYR